MVRWSVVLWICSSACGCRCSGTCSCSCVVVECSVVKWSEA